MYVFQKRVFLVEWISHLVEWIPHKKARDFIKKNFFSINFKRYTQFFLFAVLFHYHLMVNTLQSCLNEKFVFY